MIYFTYAKVSQYQCHCLRCLFQFFLCSITTKIGKYRQCYIVYEVPINNNNDKRFSWTRHQLWDYWDFEACGFRSTWLLLWDKFIIFPICLMHTYAHHASIWQLIWQRNQAQNMMSCRLTTPSININREVRRPRRVIITLHRPTQSILKSDILCFTTITTIGNITGAIWKVYNVRRTIKDKTVSC